MMSLEPALDERLERKFGTEQIEKVAVPDCITDNLSPRFEPREYQKEAFQRFIICYENQFVGSPMHLLYHMATGSGKTLIMAGLMLYLYQRGYRNFLFFVNSLNIIDKTRANFLDARSSKYLFNEKIVIDGREVSVREVANFDEADADSINIRFTTIQRLQSDLKENKENSLSIEDFADRKIVLLGDEAHHNVGHTSGRQMDMLRSWQSTVAQVSSANSDNVLLEFTATIDTSTAQLAAFFNDKVIFKYALAEFRKDMYSKEISLLRSHYGERERIVQALILNLYREELATARGINLKPVILFKARQAIAESERHQERFHALIESFSAQDVERIRAESTVGIVQQAFSYFEQAKLAAGSVAERIRANFKPENCLSANNDDDSGRNQIALNTLEDDDNPIRAVFAVHKLNEGWDVLNLFDIVRLYEGQNTGGNNKGKVGQRTIAEAQLIGRGARYYPFTLSAEQDKYKRKYDAEPENQLRALETLYYHAREEVKYISELKRALIASGIYEDEDRLVPRRLELKQSFKETEFYQRGRVFYNEKAPKSDILPISFSELDAVQSPHEHTLASGAGAATTALGNDPALQPSELTATRAGYFSVKKLATKYRHAVRYALTANPFFYFDKLQARLPELSSLSEFMTKDEYLGGCRIEFIGAGAKLTPHECMRAVSGLLAKIEAEMKRRLTQYQPTEYTNKLIREVFIDKTINVPKDTERADGQVKDVNSEDGSKDWYVFNANYGTGPEKEFVKLFSRFVDNIPQGRFQHIYLIRNERQLKIHDKDGRAFEPDFLLFCLKSNGKQLIYQVFIEPKGQNHVDKDRWKEDFLKQIKKGAEEQKQTFATELGDYVITAVPQFFTGTVMERKFEDLLKETLHIQQPTD